MKLFLDASLMLAAAGSSKGASRAIFEFAAEQGWSLISSPYAVSEVFHNLSKLPLGADKGWAQLKPSITLVDDVVSVNRPVIFAASKDRPILFTALAWADVMLTLDKQDFADLLGSTFYGLPVLLPSSFLMQERNAGRL